MKKVYCLTAFIIFATYLRSMCEDAAQMIPIFNANAALGFAPAQGNYGFWSSHADTIAAITIKSRRLTEEALGLSEVEAKGRVGKIRLTFNTTEGRLRVEAYGDEPVLTARYVNTLTSYLLVEYANTFNMKIYSIHPANPQMPKFPVERANQSALSSSEIVYDIRNPNPKKDDPPEFKDDAPPADAEPPTPKP